MYMDSSTLSASLCGVDCSFLVISISHGLSWGVQEGHENSCQLSGNGILMIETHKLTDAQNNWVIL